MEGFSVQSDKSAKSCAGITITCLTACKERLSLDHNISGLDTLLDLDGEVSPIDNGFWVKFSAYRVPVNKHIPHGIKYSLTLHDTHNQRIIGYDNDHGVKLPQKKNFSGRRYVWDHKHKKTITALYEFESAYQLLEDFWKDVNDVLKTGGV